MKPPACWGANIDETQLGTNIIEKLPKAVV